MEKIKSSTDRASITAERQQIRQLKLLQNRLLLSSAIVLEES